MSFTKNFDSWQPDQQPKYHQAQYASEPEQFQYQYAQSPAYQDYPSLEQQYNSQPAQTQYQTPNLTPFNPLLTSLRRIATRDQGNQGYAQSERPQPANQTYQNQPGAGFAAPKQFNRRGSNQPPTSYEQPQSQNNLVANLFGNFSQNDFKKIYAKLVEPKTDYTQQVCTKYGKQTIVHSDLDDPNLYEDVLPDDQRLSTLNSKLILHQDAEIFLNSAPKKIVSSGHQMNKAGLGKNYGLPQVDEPNLPFGRSQTIRDHQETEKMDLNWLSLKEIGFHFIDNEEAVKPIQDIVPEELYENYDIIYEIRNSLGEYAYVDKEFTLETNIADTQKYSSIDPYPIPWRNHNYRWQHITEIEQQTGIRYKIYDDNIHPNDIVQGKLGSCFFLSAISALA